MHFHEHSAFCEITIGERVPKRTAVRRRFGPFNVFSSFCTFTATRPKTCWPDAQPRLSHAAVLSEDHLVRAFYGPWRGLPILFNIPLGFLLDRLCGLVWCVLGLLIGSTSPYNYNCRIYTSVFELFLTPVSFPIGIKL